MCGICGIYAPKAGAGLGPLQAMTASLAHRGPDDQGLWTDAEAGLALGHRRLSILDLSPRGHQPMVSASGRYVLCYNGEIFNFERLRAELAPLGHRFKGGSDTEVMLAAIEQWGVGAAVQRMNGMFALALWDRRERSLSLVRDRLGVKPLYLGRLGSDGGAGGLVFGSELKALRQHPDFDPSLDTGALALYFRHNYIPAPHTIYRHAQKILPGEIVTFSEAGETRRRYWDAGKIWQDGFSQPCTFDETQAVDALEELLTDAVGLRMLSDVPLGAFLSGGVDSSLVAALMQRQSSRPVKTFSIGFAEAAFNEAPHAKAVAAHLGCEHTELTVTARDLLAVVPDLPRIWDEPFADSSQIPTLLLCRLTRSHVTVALSGDGGDELFSGYQRYPWTLKAHSLLSAVPGPLRAALYGLARLLPQGLWGLLGPRGHKLRWRLDALGVQGFEALYRHFVSHLKDPAALVPGAFEPGYPAASLPPMGNSAEARRAWMSLADILGYLPDDILTKVDRASMAVALEARTPLLDYRVVEFAARTPMGLKVRQGQDKWLLRRVLHRHVPRHLVERPKMGFGIPVAAWLRAELRPWAEDLLSPARIKRQGILDPAFTARIWSDFLRGEDNWSHSLWDLLMFQAWLDCEAAGAQDKDSCGF